MSRKKMVKKFLVAVSSLLLIFFLTTGMVLNTKFYDAGGLGSEQLVNVTEVLVEEQLPLQNDDENVANSQQNRSNQPVLKAKYKPTKINFSAESDLDFMELFGYKTNRFKINFYSSNADRTGVGVICVNNDAESIFLDPNLLFFENVIVPNNIEIENYDDVLYLKLEIGIVSDYCDTKYEMQLCKCCDLFLQENGDKALATYEYKIIEEEVCKLKYVLKIELEKV